MPSRARRTGGRTTAQPASPAGIRSSYPTVAKPVRERAHAKHRKRHQRNTERDAPPEAARHIAQFGILFFRRRNGHGLQRHTADRTSARCVSYDLGMHRASPLCAGGSPGHFGFQRHAAFRACSGAGLANLGVHGTDVSRGRDWRGLRRSTRAQRRSSTSLHQVLFRIRLELVGTAPTAKVVGRAFMLEGGSGPGWVNVHAANWIALQFWRRLDRDSANLYRSGHSSRLVGRRQILCRVGTEFLGASFATEVIQLARVLDRSRSLEGIDGHAADRVFVGFAGRRELQGRFASLSVRGRVRVRDEFRGIGDEAMHAFRGAKAVSDAQVLGVASGLGGID